MKRTVFWGLLSLLAALASCEEKQQQSNLSESFETKEPQISIKNSILGEHWATDRPSDKSPNYVIEQKNDSIYNFMLKDFGITHTFTFEAKLEKESKDTLVFKNNEDLTDDLEYVFFYSNELQRVLYTFRQPNEKTSLGYGMFSKSELKNYK